MKDIRSDLAYAVALDPQTIASDTTTTGEIIDTADYDGGVMVTQLATVTDGTFLPVLEESADSTFATYSAIADANLIGTEADATLSTTQAVSTIGINNTLRYIRYKVTSASTTTGAVIAAVYHKKAEVKPAV